MIVETASGNAHFERSLASTENIDVFTLRGPQNCVQNSAHNPSLSAAMGYIIHDSVQGPSTRYAAYSSLEDERPGAGKKMYMRWDFPPHQGEGVVTGCQSTGTFQRSPAFGTFQTCGSF